MESNAQRDLEEKLAKQINDKKFLAEQKYFREMRRLEELANIAVNDDIRDYAFKVYGAISDIYLSEKDDPNFNLDTLTRHLINANNALLYPYTNTLDKLISDAANLPGKPSLGWKILGGLLFGLGAAIAAFGGVVLAIGLGVTGTGIGFAAGVPTAAFGGGLIAGGLALAGCGAGFFHSGCHIGSNKEIQDLHDALKDLDNQPAVKLDSTSEAKCVDELAEELLRKILKFQFNNHGVLPGQLEKYSSLIRSIKNNADTHPTEKIFLILFFSWSLHRCVNENYPELGKSIEECLKTNIKDQNSLIHFVIDTLSSYNATAHKNLDSYFVSRLYSFEQGKNSSLSGLSRFYHAWVTENFDSYSNKPTGVAGGKTIRELVNNYVDLWNENEVSRLQLMAHSEKEVSESKRALK